MADLELLLKNLKSPSEDVKINAVSQLTEFSSDPRVVPALKELLNGQSPKIKYYARRILSGIEKKSNGQTPSKENNQEAETSEAFIPKLTLSTTPTSLKKPQNADSHKLKRQLKSEIDRKRKEAVETIGENLVEDLYPELKNMLNSESDNFVKATLLKAIGNFKNEEDIMLIKDFLKDKDSRIRANAVEALELIGSQKAYSFIVPMLKDEDNRVEANALKAIQEYAETIDVLKLMVFSPLAWKKESGIYALSHTKTRECFELLLELIDQETDIETVKKVIQIIKTFEQYEDEAYEKYKSLLPNSQGLKKTALKNEIIVYESKLEEDPKKKKQPQKPVQEEIQTFKVCLECEHKNPLSKIKCEKCNSVLQTKCSACGTLNAPGQEFCSSCFKELKKKKKKKKNIAIDIEEISTPSVVEASKEESTSIQLDIPAVDIPENNAMQGLSSVETADSIYADDVIVKKRRGVSDENKKNSAPLMLGILLFFIIGAGIFLYFKSQENVKTKIIVKKKNTKKIAKNSLKKRAQEIKKKEKLTKLQIADKLYNEAIEIKNSQGDLKAKLKFLAIRKKHPEHLKTIEQLAKIELNLKNYKGAIKAYNDYIRYSKETKSLWPIRYTVGKCYLKIGNKPTALSQFLLILESEEPDKKLKIKTYLIAAQIQEFLGYKYDAAKNYELYINISGQRNKNLLKKIAFLRGDEISDIGKKLNKNQKKSRNITKKGKAYLKEDSPQAAIDLFKQAIQLDPKYITPRTKLAEAYYEIAEYEKALPILKMLFKARLYTKEILSLYGKTLYKLEQTHFAIKILNEAHKKDPKNFETLYFLANALEDLYKKNKNIKILQQCIKVYNKCLDIDPTNEKARKITIWINDLNKLYKEIIKSENDPNSPENQYKKALNLKKNGNFAQAIFILESIINKNPDMLKAFFQLGKCNFEKRNFKKALDYFDYFYKQNDTDLTNMYYLGHTLLKLKDIEKAMPIFHRILKLYPKNKKAAEINLILANCYEKYKRNIKGAIVFYEEYLKIGGPKFKTVARIVDKLKEKLNK